MKVLRYAIDQVSPKTLVLVGDEDCKMLELPRDRYDYPEGEILDITFDDNNEIISAVLIEGEGERRRTENANRLKKLFNKKR